MPYFVLNPGRTEILSEHRNADLANEVCPAEGIVEYHPIGWRVQKRRRTAEKREDPGGDPKPIAEYIREAEDPRFWPKTPEHWLWVMVSNLKKNVDRMKGIR